MPQVLADEEYARRKEFYLESGQRHYYFMTIGNGETIDACRKVTQLCCTNPAVRIQFMHKGS